MSWSSHRLGSPDYENSRIIECSIIEDESTMVCESFNPESDTAVWDVTINGIQEFENGIILGEYVYLLTLDDKVVAAFIGSP